ncbi:MAG: hypothetical protein AB1941_11360 [Gemmatimonadota bacterium]
MGRSFIHLRRALFGTSCAVVFAFGATQALAAPQQTSRDEVCTRTDAGHAHCAVWCQNNGHDGGKCGADGVCFCLDFTV